MIPTDHVLLTGTIHNKDSVCDMFKNFVLKANNSEVFI